MSRRFYSTYDSCYINVNFIVSVWVKNPDDPSDDMGYDVIAKLSDGSTKVLHLGKSKSDAIFLLNAFEYWANELYGSE